MTHALNLAAYCTRRAAAALAAGDTEKADKMMKAAEHWEREAKAS